jgi:hypothetical protein
MAQQTIVTATKPWVSPSRESRALSLDFVDNLDGSSLSGVVSVTSEQIEAGDTSDGSALSLGSGTVVGTTVRFNKSGGYDGAAHWVRIEVTRADGATLVGVGRLNIANQ